MRYLLKVWGIIRTAFFSFFLSFLLSSEPAWLPSTTLVCQVVLPLGSAAPVASQPQLCNRGSDRDRDGRCSLALNGRRQQRHLPRRTMLRGKSRLNVEWLGYSPGMLLDHRPPPEGRTLRSPDR